MSRLAPLFLFCTLCFALFGCSDDDQGNVDATLPTDQSTERAPFGDGPNTDAARSDAPTPDGREADALARDLALPESGTADQALSDTTTTTDGAAPDPGPVQCRNDAECASGQTCNRTAPGGICLGCGTCLDSIDFECRSGACVRYCSGDSQCNAGMRCTNTGLCVIRNCSSNEPCPAPYVCGGSARCERPACGVGDSCPAPLSCDDGLCIEP